LALTSATGATCACRLTTIVPACSTSTPVRPRIRLQSTPGGLGFGSFLLGDVTSFNRYVSTSTNAKEFQKRTFFYAQDTWRATKHLTLNLGVRWDLYFPESTNGPGNGALLNLKDGYLHVAGIGGIPSNLGWSVDKGSSSRRVSASPIS
jgi:outer membrane receptor protein involved in Fe transport